MSAKEQSEYSFCEVKDEHLNELTEIYNYYVLNSTATFHSNVMTPEEMKSLVMFKRPIYRAFVILRSNSSKDTNGINEIVDNDNSCISGCNNNISNSPSYGQICGYVTLGQHKSRDAYDTTGEIGLYLRPEYTGKGIGSIAVKHIEEFAAKNGFHALIATITAENEQSIRLFEKNGYVKCAHYREVGIKFGRWLDVVAYEKILANRPE